ncbi:MAG TPA: DUF4389 domain-containing protein [Pseudomonadales bacterium]|nr:DUF4389 domain-containing protein [Pseudomonadales bacterium]
MNKFKDTVTSDSFWVKTLFVVMFFLVYRVLDIVLLLATLGQWLFTLITGSPHASLVKFGASLGLYLQQITFYLTSVSEDKPYPFQDWPRLQQEDDE